MNSADIEIPVHIFVGTDETQSLAVQVLEYSIRKYASVPVRVEPLLNVPVPLPADPKNRPRTGFSFARFLIPSLRGFRGRAIYLDADMLVFKDIAALAQIDFPQGAGLAYVPQPPDCARVSQFSVMVLDCSRLAWDIRDIVARLDRGEFNYEELMYEFKFVAPHLKAACVPAIWNALEHYKEGSTALIHFTDMHRQPWVYGNNPYGYLWYDALRSGIQDGFISSEMVVSSINKGYVSPRLGEWLGMDLEGVVKNSGRWRPPYARLAPPYWRRFMRGFAKWTFHRL